uniref:Putative histone acetyltransferase saga associated factor sgf29 n=1 Tax=Xenopsylla cheopis TaxID=163159 RepID=A0A6M2DNW4_XENCH
MFKTPLATESTALQIQERLQQLFNLVSDIEKERSKNDHSLLALKTQQEKMIQDDRVNTNHAQRLKNMCKNIVSESKREEELLRLALLKINDIRTIRNEHRIQARNAAIKQTIRRGEMFDLVQRDAKTLPLFVSRYGEVPPPLCGAVPAESNYILKPGDMVAAFGKTSDGEENWMLAKVASWNPSSNKYVVDDIDDEQKNRHTLIKSKVIPLPLMRANPKTDELALFPKGTIVMALFPQTTCFYKGVIHELPVDHTDGYKVIFEDSEKNPEVVAQRYVIAFKQSKSHKLAA